MTGVVHVAGAPIDGAAQFCSDCAAVLLDFEGVSFAVPDGQENWSPAFWPEGALVLRDGAMSCTVEAVAADEVRCT